MELAPEAVTSPQPARRSARKPRAAVSITGQPGSADRPDDYYQIPGEMKHRRDCTWLATYMSSPENAAKVIRVSAVSVKDVEGCSHCCGKKGH